MGKWRIKRKRPTYTFEEELMMVTLMHFPQGGMEDEDYTCEKCGDYIQGYCAGEGRKGFEVMDCMACKVRNGEEMGCL